MEFIIKYSGNMALMLRRAGYHYLTSQKDEMNFVHPLGQNSYPRFHLYIRENKQTKEITCSLHLDQKKPSYKGAPAHSAEYDSVLVEKETARLKSILH